MKKILILALLCAAGCTSMRQDPGHKVPPSLKEEGYTLMEPLPIDFMAEAGAADRQFMQAIVRMVDKAKDDPEALAKALDRIRYMTEIEWVNWSDLKNRMKKGDKLFYFTFKQNNYDDYGVLVLRDKDIVFRHTLGSGFWNWEVDGKQLESAPLTQNLDNL